MTDGPTDSDPGPDTPSDPGPDIDPESPEALASDTDEDTEPGEYVERFSATSVPGFFDTYDEAVEAGERTGKPFSIGKTFVPSDHPLLEQVVTVAGEDDEPDEFVDDEPELEQIGDDTGGPLTNAGVTPPT